MTSSASRLQCGPHYGLHLKRGIRYKNGQRQSINLPQASSVCSSSPPGSPRKMSRPLLATSVATSSLLSTLLTGKASHPLLLRPHDVQGESEPWSRGFQVYTNELGVTLVFLHFLRSIRNRSLLPLVHLVQTVLDPHHLCLVLGPTAIGPDITHACMWTGLSRDPDTKHSPPPDTHSGN